MAPFNVVKRRSDLFHVCLVLSGISAYFFAKAIIRFDDHPPTGSFYQSACYTNLCRVFDAQVYAKDCEKWISAIVESPEGHNKHVFQYGPMHGVDVDAVAKDMVHTDVPCQTNAVGQSVRQQCGQPSGKAYHIVALVGWAVAIFIFWLAPAFITCERPSHKIPIAGKIASGIAIGIIPIALTVTGISGLIVQAQRESSSTCGLSTCDVLYGGRTGHDVFLHMQHRPHNTTKFAMYETFRTSAAADAFIASIENTGVFCATTASGEIVSECHDDRLFHVAMNYLAAAAFWCTMYVGGLLLAFDLQDDWVDEHEKETASLRKETEKESPPVPSPITATAPPFEVHIHTGDTEGAHPRKVYNTPVIITENQGA